MLSYFTDPVLRGPTIGTMLMCVTAALVGSLTFLRRQSLVGEALSHAAYPGVMVGVILTGMLSVSDDVENLMISLIMGGAFLTALLGLWSIFWLEKKFSIRSDSALCLILSTFFGIGVTLASDVQFSFTALYRQAQTYLYGQAATMTDWHILVYGLLSAIVISVIMLFNKELETLLFSQEYAVSLGIQTRWINGIIFVLMAMAVVIGIRSVGVVLMSAMLIAPPVAARQFTNRFQKMLWLAALFGLISGFLGCYASVELTRYFSALYPESRLAFPTGPMIVLVASAICLISLLIAPERGFLVRLIREYRLKHSTPSRG